MLPSVELVRTVAVAIATFEPVGCVVVNPPTVLELKYKVSFTE